MSCNNCSCSPCCCVTPFRYKGPNVDCLGVLTNTTYDSLIEKFANEICELNEVVQDVYGVDHVSFTSSTGDPSNIPGQAGQIDTYTIWADEGETIAISTFNITNGTAGIDGTNGTDGIDGTNGSSILGAYNSATGIGNAAGLGLTTFFSAPLLANTLSTDGDELEVFAYIEYQENDPVDLIFSLASGETFTYNVANSESDVRFIKIKIARIDQNNQMWSIEALVKNALSLKAVERVDIAYTTFDLSTATTFEILADNINLAGANALRLKKAVLYLDKV